jgi:glycosyltransferase involved in cell wall biosynthesis
VIGPDEPDKPDAVPEISKREAEACGVSFLGERRDVEDLYSSFDLYVLASHREGVPRSAMEAAATGLPIVATNIRGCRQVVEDGGTGRLVPLGDISALTQAILELSRDADLRARLGRAGIEKARREFDERRVIAITLAAYACLLDQARPAGRRPGRQVLSRR